MCGTKELKAIEEAFAEDVENPIELFKELIRNPKYQDKIVEINGTENYKKYEIIIYDFF